jgi:hypothetical protein
MNKQTPDYLDLKITKHGHPTIRLLSTLQIKPTKKQVSKKLQPNKGFLQTERQKSNSMGKLQLKKHQKRSIKAIFHLDLPELKDFSMTFIKRYFSTNINIFGEDVVGSM